MTATQNCFHSFPKELAGLLDCTNGCTLSFTPRSLKFISLSSFLPTCLLQPQNNGKPLTCTWERLLHKRGACGQIYPGVGVVILPFLSSRNQALLPKGLKHNPYIYRTLPLPAATETAIKQTGNPANSCAFKRMSR